MRVKTAVGISTTYSRIKNIRLLYIAYPVVFTRPREGVMCNSVIILSILVRHKRRINGVRAAVGFVHGSRATVVGLGLAPSPCSTPLFIIAVCTAVRGCY